MYKIKFTKMTTQQNRLRTIDVLGVAVRLPELRQRFTLFGKPLTKDTDVRIVETSSIMKIDWFIPDKICLLETDNNQYRVEVLETIGGQDQDTDRLLQDVFGDTGLLEDLKHYLSKN